MRGATLPPFGNSRNVEMNPFGDVFMFSQLRKDETKEIPLKYLFAIFILLLAGCSASGPYFQETRYARQSVSADKARIIFFRGRDANYRSVTLEIDGETIGKLAAGGFLVEDTAPGPHRIVASVSFTLGEYAAKLNAQAGQTYYIRVSNRDERTLYGFMGDAGTFLTFADRGGFFRLRLVDPTAAIIALEELQLSEQ